MNCYIKDRKTFTTLLQRPVSSWSVCVDSQTPERSTLTLPCDDVPPSMTRNWAVFDGIVFLIDKIRTDNGVTNLSLLPFWAAFDREFVFVASTTYMGAFIRAWINAGWVTQSDTEFALPFLTVTSTDTTSYQTPEKSENGVFSLLDYMVLARQKNVLYTASHGSTGMTMTISTHVPAEHVLVENDGHTKLISCSFQGSAVSKVTVVQPVSGNVTQTVWYLDTDGDIGTTVPAHRADGDWKTIEITEDAVQYDEVRKVVDENDRSYKVQFWSDIDMEVGDTYQMRLNGSVFSGTISAKYKSSDDGRTRYSSGALPTTLTERVARLGG